jgi:autotransporter-associated beta strand protein
VLSGSTAYAGNTAINAGILQFGKTSALYGGTTSNWVRTKITGSSGATLAVNVGGEGEFQPADVTTLLSGIMGTVASNGLLAGSNIGFDTTNSGTAVTLADVVADTLGTGGGAVGLRKLGSGTLVLSASNTFTGATTVGYAGGPNSGVLQLAGTGHVSPAVTIFGGTFDTAGQNRTITTLRLGGGAAGSTASLQTGSGTVTSGTGGVTFDATNAPNGGTIAGNLSLGGATRTFTVNDSTAATADLTISAVINQGAAAAGLTKSGSGTLALTGTNTFTGKVAVNQGVVQIDWINDSGASPLGTNTTTDLGSAWRDGTLRWVGATSGTTSRTFNLSGTTGGGTIEASGLGALVITSTVTATGAGAKTFTLGGTGTAANTIGAIQNNSGTTPTSVVKDGPGTWRINAASTYTGSFTVRNGTLVAAVDSLANQNGAFGGSTGPNDVLIGDTSPTATGTAALLLAAGISTGKVMNVQAGGGSQAVVLGGEAGVVDFRNESSVLLGRPVTLVAGAGGTTSFSGQWYGTGGVGTSPTVNVSIGSAGNTGVVSILRSLATSGSVGVGFGTLNLGSSGTIAASGGPLGIDQGATLAGIGFVTGTLGGAGLVAPGNSPGILTAGAVNPTGGLDWAFEFTGTAPDYGNASASINDVLRLTGTASSPFTTALTSANEIAVYLDVASLAEGNTFRGGFFTNLAGDFRSSIADAAYTYWVSGTGAGQTTYLSKTYVPLATAYPSLSMDVTTVATTATFSGELPTNGQVTTFTVVVPEPGAIALAALGLGLAAYAARRRL